MADQSTGREVLPADPTPVEYALRIEPDLTKFTYTGSVRIKLSASASVQSVVLNAAKLVVDAVQFSTPVAGTDDERSTPVTDTVMNAALQQMRVDLAHPFTGEGTLSIRFHGAVRDDLFGFYRSTYKDAASGQEKCVLATQFCPVDARCTFPCWDEPGRKARFTATLVAPVGVNVLFNTPAVQSVRLPVSAGTPDTERVEWTFGQTPVMSTYLLAWAFGEFDLIERCVPKTFKTPLDDARGMKCASFLEGNKYTADSTLVRIATTPGKTELALFAVDIATRVISLYEKTFGCNYPLPKLDILAMPDFAFGGMENWGLILCRESVVLCEEDADANQKAAIATVVAHEVSHMWFGDLVTMDWWKELWLNESFATYVTTWALQKIHPEWELETQFAFEECSRAFALDALRSSHPIEMHIASARELDGVFDAISYAKGGSVLRMVLSYLGEQVFFSGVKTYVSRFHYRNATTRDLWQALGEAANEDLVAVLANWTNTQGFPYLRVSATPDSEDNLTIVAEQRRFLSVNDVKDEEDTVLWQIPLVVEAGTSISKSVMIKERVQELLKAPKSAAAFAKVNKDQTAFCRVLYTEELLEPLLAHLRTLTVLDRFSILADYVAFARGGYCSTLLTLRVLSHYSLEEDYTVLCEAFAFTGSLRSILASRGQPAVQRFNSYVCELFKHVAEKLGYRHRPADSVRLRRLRSLLFAEMVAAQSETALSAAQEIFAQSKLDPATGRVSGIPGDQRATVFAVQVQRNGEEGLQHCMKRAAQMTDQMERAYYLNALAATAVDNAVPRLFDFCLSGEVRTQDLLHLLRPLATSSRLGNAAVGEMILRWDAIASKAPGVLQTRILLLAGQANDASLLPKLKQLFERLPESSQSSLRTSFLQASESLSLNAAWLQRDAESVDNSLLGSA